MKATTGCNLQLAERQTYVACRLSARRTLLILLLTLSSALPAQTGVLRLRHVAPDADPSGTTTFCRLECNTCPTNAQSVALPFGEHRVSVRCRNGFSQQQSVWIKSSAQSLVMPGRRLSIHFSGTAKLEVSGFQNLRPEDHWILLQPLLTAAPAIGVELDGGKESVVPPGR